MLASELKVGDWIKPTVCQLGHQLGPTRVIEVNKTSDGHTFVRLLPLFEPNQIEATHDLWENAEVELCLFT